MHVFLCWSGAASQKIAKALHGFLPDVIQDLKPFLSSENISKGERWRSEISERLAGTNFGILCLTRDNLKAPWILFEAGALSRNIDEGRVTALLAGINPTDVVEPLSQFQQTRADHEDILRLLKDMNALIPEAQRLPTERLERAFSKYWPDFETKLVEALKVDAPGANVTPSRSTHDMVSELLELVREQKREADAHRRAAETENIFAGLRARDEAAYLASAAKRGDVDRGTSSDEFLARLKRVDYLEQNNPKPPAVEK